MNQSTLISIIVPVYNRAYCLSRCLDSIMNQSYTYWECLLVDDGSTDTSLSVCREYADKDSRFRVFHQENRGVSMARNLGVDHAEGRYVAFIDSDDWVAKNYLEKLYAGTGEKCIAICNSSETFENTTKSAVDVIPDGYYAFDNSSADFLADYFFSRVLPPPVCRLYDREIIEREKIRFVRGIHYGEDTVFNCYYLRYVDHIRMMSDVLYHIMKQENSLTTQVRIDFSLPDCHKRIVDEAAVLLHFKNLYNGKMEVMFYFDYILKCVISISSIQYMHSCLSFNGRYIWVRDQVRQADRKRIKKYLSKIDLKPNLFKLICILIYLKYASLLFLYYEMKSFFRRYM